MKIFPITSESCFAIGMSLFGRLDMFIIASYLCIIAVNRLFEIGAL